MMYTVTPWLDIESDFFSGYAPDHTLATAPDLELRVDATLPEVAADLAYAIGNRQGADMFDRTWPSDVRSLSVGDLLTIHWWEQAGPRRQLHLAVDRFGFMEVPEPSNPRVPLAGTTATSREATA